MKAILPSFSLIASKTDGLQADAVMMLGYQDNKTEDRGFIQHKQQFQVTGEGIKREGKYLRPDVKREEILTGRRPRKRIRNNFAKSHG